MRRRFAFFLIVGLLSGCVTAYKFDLKYSPEPKVLPALVSKTFNVSVTDERPYVTHGEKFPFFLGIIRQGYGIPRDVVSANKTPLADQIESDLSRELESLGLVRSSSPSRQIKIHVRDWNFDTGPRTRFWYDTELTIENAAGKALLTRRIKNEMTFETNIFDMGDELKDQLPKKYAHFIEAIFRDDAKTLAALEREPQGS
jgi:hypothetical protein